MVARGASPPGLRRRSNQWRDAGDPKRYFRPCEGARRAPPPWRCPGRRRCTWSPGRGCRRCAPARAGLDQQDRAGRARPGGRARWRRRRRWSSPGRSPARATRQGPGRRRPRSTRRGRSRRTLSPVFSSSLRTAGTGPRPITLGSTPACAQPRMRAFGFSPAFCASSPCASTSAAAPSLMPLALPAVTVPSFSKAGRSLARPSEVVALGCSSVSKGTCPASP